MIDCKEAVRRMWTYLDRGLEADSTEELEEHLDVCQRCCGELEFSRHVRSMLEDAEGRAVVPPGLRARVELLLTGETTRREPR